MNRPLRKFLGAAGAAALAVGMLTVGTASAGGTVQVCSGTPKAPGVLSGTYAGDVVVNGACAVNMGTAVVEGNLTVSEGSGLIAAFVLNDGTGTGMSNLTVQGDLRVEHHAVLLLGCDPRGFPCLDDPNQKSPTLSSHSDVKDIIGEQALGVIADNDEVHQSISLKGGGGGVNCNPVGIFKAFQSPAFSAIEDSNVDGGVRITGVHSCWMGVNEMTVAGDVVIDNNHLADPDAIEILANHIGGDLDCQGNTMVWDSSEAGRHLFPRSPQPNTVLGNREASCRLSSPTSPTDPPGPDPF